MAFETRFCSNCATPLEWITLAEDSGDVTRLRCPACGYTHWGNPTPVLAAVVENDRGEALLARNALWQEGVFGLITGFMEAGESPEAGICREVMEETGLRAKALRLLGSWEFLRMNQVLIAYHVRVEGGPDDVRLSPELLEHRWVTPQAARCWPAGTGYALAHWIREKGVEPQFGAFRPGQSAAAAVEGRWALFAAPHAGVTSPCALARRPLRAVFKAGCVSFTGGSGYRC